MHLMRACFIGKVYLVGGLVKQDAYSRESCDGKVDVYHTPTSEWDYIPSLKEPRYNHETVTLSKDVLDLFLRIVFQVSIFIVLLPSSLRSSQDSQAFGRRYLAVPT